MRIIYENKSGQIINGDNIEVMKSLESNSIDSCISDFPYALGFMGKKWDSAKHWHTGEFKGNKCRPNTKEDKIKFYDWCYERALELIRIIKPGGYVCIFGHPKTNHRMKSAFEDAGFNIIEEIEWIYLNGFPKNQDIGKLFDKKAGVKREIIGQRKAHDIKCNGLLDRKGTISIDITVPTTEQAKKWNGWKTAGLKPAHEPITIFQKPLEGTFIQNIEKWGCGAMNIDVCRVPISRADMKILKSKESKNPTSNYSSKENKVYGKFAVDIVRPANPEGRFPPNMIFDEYTKEIVDEQTGTSKSVGGSRIFPIIKYCTKVAPKERTLPNGIRNPHVTVKPVELIKWLIKLVTPIDGRTIDITAGSGTHAVACEQLNNEGYELKWVNIELQNSEEEPYCDIAKMRVGDKANENSGN